jgi:uncharacterized protein YjbJ (UPF0337 family)
VDENRVEGTARNVKGKFQEDIGSLAGNARMRAEGLTNQAAGAAQDLYGQAADATRQTADTVDQWLRRTIETRPYASVLVALGVGWLIGRMNRPL